MSIKQTILRTIRRMGFEVGRFPQSHPLWRTSVLLEHLDPDLLIDVGANDGGFASAARTLGYKGDIVSFEPLLGPYATLAGKSAHDPRWTVFRMALGNDSANVDINVAGNDGMSSSILPMLARHSAAAPASSYVGTETARLERLDDMAAQLGITADSKVFLKIDVQGYERQVIQGASELFARGIVVGMEMELSLVPLYEGSISAQEGVRLAGELGLELVGLIPGFTDVETGRLLQFDGVFARLDA